LDRIEQNLAATISVLIFTPGSWRSPEVQIWNLSIPFPKRFSVILNSMKERRRATRAPIKVQMEGRKNGDVFTGTSVNLSETGILIETAKHLDIGAKVTVHLILPSEVEVTGVGEVVRLEDRGMDKFALAVHWELSTEQRIAVARLIHDSAT
jgi:hypothetical protein